MIAKRRLIHAAKYGIAILFVGAMSFFVISKFASEEEPKTFDKFGADFKYFPDIALQFSEEMLDENFDICFFETLVFKEDKMNTSLKELFPKFSKYKDFQEYSKAEKIETRSPFKVLKKFADLMSLLNIEVVLIEPFILFCMLSPSHKDLLLRRKFDPKMYSNMTQVVTFGIRETYIPSLEKKEIQAQIKKFNFSIEFVLETSKSWMKEMKSEFSKNFFISHVFLKHNLSTVHLVVLHNRSTYLWHASLNSLYYENLPPLEELYFVEEDSAYDGLTAISPNFTEKALANIRIPSNPQYFLFEMTSSKFLECNSSVVSRFLHYDNGDTDSKSKSPSAQRYFNNKAIVAIRELKRKLNPLLIHFWIWGGTMLGWYRQCGVIPYTTDVDFAAWAVEVDNLTKIVDLFSEKEFLKLKQRMGLVQEGLELNLDCYKVRVDLFFLYAQNNGSWYAGHRPSKGYYFKYHHPHFSLCSTELLEHKVLVPCEVEVVISAEYGPNWMTPVAKWNYESSIRNRGPNIYWANNMLKTVYS